MLRHQQNSPVIKVESGASSNGDQNGTSSPSITTTSSPSPPAPSGPANGNADVPGHSRFARSSHSPVSLVSSIKSESSSPYGNENLTTGEFNGHHRHHRHASDSLLRPRPQESPMSLTTKGTSSDPDSVLTSSCINSNSSSPSNNVITTSNGDQSSSPCSSSSPSLSVTSSSSLPPPPSRHPPPVSLVMKTDLGFMMDHSHQAQQHVFHHGAYRDEEDEDFDDDTPTDLSMDTADRVKHEVD